MVAEYYKVNGVAYGEREDILEKYGQIELVPTEKPMPPQAPKLYPLQEFIKDVPPTLKISPLTKFVAPKGTPAEQQQVERLIREAPPYDPLGGLDVIAPLFPPLMMFKMGQQTRKAGIDLPDVTDVAAPLFPPLMLWKMGEHLPPEIAPMISPISGVSLLGQIAGTPEQQKAVIDRSIIMGGDGFKFPDLGELGKYALIAGGLILGAILLTRKQ